MYKLIKAAVVLVAGLFAKNVVARDRDFNPLQNLEVLVHGETEIASFPSGTTCCTVTAINLPPIDSSEYDRGEGPKTELHVTAVGQRGRYVSQDNIGLYTDVHRQKVARPPSYYRFAFDPDNVHSETCEDITGLYTEALYKKSVSSHPDQVKVENLRSEIKRKKEGSAFQQVAFTFFGPNVNPKESAVITCWQPEDDVLIGGMLAERNYPKHGV